MSNFITFKNLFKIFVLSLMVLPGALSSQMNDAVFTFGVVDPDAGTMEVIIENTDPVYSFNVFISGIAINNIFGGVIDSNGFNVNVVGNHEHHIHGFMQGMGGEPIEPGTHLLFTVSFELIYSLSCIYSASCQGNGQSNFDVDLEACYQFEPENNDSGYFSNILNGYLDNYLQFSDTTGAGVISYITIEEAVELDFGDDIGLLSFEGSTNYGDCSDEFGEILVGSEYWQGGPMTIPAYGAIDQCDEGGFQLPGFIAGDPMSIHVWDADQGIEYEMDIIQRDDIPWTPGHVVISAMNFGAVSGMTGDIDNDGNITVTDVVIMIAMILETFEGGNQDIIRADINLDERVDILDVVALIEVILNP